MPSFHQNLAKKNTATQSLISTLGACCNSCKLRDCISNWKLLQNFQFWAFVLGKQVCIHYKQCTTNNKISFQKKFHRNFNICHIFVSTLHHCLITTTSFQARNIHVVAVGKTPCCCIHKQLHTALVFGTSWRKDALRGLRTQQMHEEILASALAAKILKIA